MTHRFDRPRLALCGLLSALPFAALAAAPAAPTAPKPDAVIAREGSVTMTAAEVMRLIAALDPQTRARVAATPNGLRDLLRGALAQKAVVAQAKSKDWQDKPDVKAAIAIAADNVIGQTYLASVSQPDPGYPTDAQLQAAYQANLAQFQIPRQFHLAEVLIPGAANAPPKQSPAALFAAGTPNDLGSIPEARLSPSMHDLLAKMQPGATAAPIHLADGWHVIKLVGVTPARTATLAEVRPQLVEAMRRQQSQAKAQGYLTGLADREHAAVDEIALAALLNAPSAAPAPKP